MRFDGHSNFGQAHDTSATTPAVEAAEPTSDRITAQHNDKHHNPTTGCAVCVREAATPAVVQPEADVYGDTFRTVYDTAIANGASKVDAAADASFAASAAHVLAAAAASVIRIDVKTVAKLPDMNADHTDNTYALYCRGELVAVSTPESRSMLRH